AALTTPDDYCLKMLSHVLRAEEAWLTRLRGGTPENRVWDVSSREELEALRILNDAALETFVNEEPGSGARAALHPLRRHAHGINRGRHPVARLSARRASSRADRRARDACGFAEAAVPGLHRVRARASVMRSD